jgi:hypothetical protein
MEQVDPLTPQVERDPELFPNRVGGSRLGHRPEIVAELLQGAAILAAAQQDELRGLVDA